MRKTHLQPTIEKYLIITSLSSQYHSHRQVSHITQRSPPSSPSLVTITSLSSQYHSHRQVSHITQRSPPSSPSLVSLASIIAIGKLVISHREVLHHHITSLSMQDLLYNSLQQVSHTEKSSITISQVSLRRMFYIIAFSKLVTQRRPQLIARHLLASKAAILHL